MSFRTTAQETVTIDISGLNVNQATAITLLNEACTTPRLDLSPEGTALLSLCGRINQLDPTEEVGLSQLQQVANAIALEEVFALGDSLISLSNFQTSNVRARLQALRQPSNNSARSRNTTGNNSHLGINGVASASLSGGSASGDLLPRLGGFINGHVSSGDIDGGRLQQDADISASSITLGADYRIIDNVIAGIGVGFIQDETTFTRITGGSQSDGANITAFASWFVAEEGYLDFVLDIGQQEFDLQRPIAIDSALPLSANSSPSSNTTTITVSAGRNFRPYGFDLGGFFRLSHARATIDSYAETIMEDITGFAALVSIAEQTVTSTKMVFGVELSKSINTQSAVLVPLLRLEYVSENEREKEDIVATLIATGTQARFQGEDLVSSYSNLGIGVSAVFAGGRSAFIFYETHLQHDLISQDWLNLGLRLEF